MEDPVRHANHRFRGAESEPGDGGEHSEVADWRGTRRDGVSLFHRWGATYRKERLVILRLDKKLTTWLTGLFVNLRKKKHHENDNEANNFIALVAANNVNRSQVA